jgi:hypothetical protein
MLPLCYGREIQDLVFFYKALYGYVDLDIGNYYVEQLNLKTLNLIEQFICGTQCVELDHLIASWHYF